MFIINLDILLCKITKLYFFLNNTYTNCLIRYLVRLNCFWENTGYSENHCYRIVSSACEIHPIIK